jgi:hypothetical protein
MLAVLRATRRDGDPDGLRWRGDRGATFWLTCGAGRATMGGPARVPARRTVANAGFGAPAARPNESLQCIGAPGTSATTGNARGGRTEY